MLTSLLLLGSLSAWCAPSEEGTVLVDARLPADIALDGVRLAQLFTAGKLEVHTTPGQHLLMVTTNGNQRTLKINVDADTTSSVLVGRNGVSATTTAPPAPEADHTPVEFRISGDEGLLVRIGDQKLSVGPGQTAKIDLVPGNHAVSMRNLAGTIIWARGTLHVGGAELVVVQLTEGRTPEVSGMASFSPASGG